MSFATFLFLTIFIIAGVWLFKFVRKVRRIYRMVFFGEVPGGAKQRQGAGQTRQRAYRPEPRRNKVFSEQDGE